MHPSPFYSSQQSHQKRQSWIFTCGVQVFVYYCKNSGKHAVTTNCNLNKAPRRATDHALVVDTQQYTVKLYTTDGGVKYIKRK